MTLCIGHQHTTIQHQSNAAKHFFAITKNSFYNFLSFAKSVADYYFCHLFPSFVVCLRGECLGHDED